MGVDPAWTISNGIKVAGCFVCLVYNSLYLLSPSKSAPIRRAQQWNGVAFLFAIPYIFFERLLDSGEWRVSTILFSPVAIGIAFSGLETIHGFAFAYYLAVNDKRLTRPAYLYPTYMGMGVLYSFANITLTTMSVVLDSYFFAQLFVVCSLLMLLGPGILSIWHLFRVIQVIKKRILSRRLASGENSGTKRTSLVRTSKNSFQRTSKKKPNVRMNKGSSNNLFSSGSEIAKRSPKIVTTVQRSKVENFTAEEKSSNRTLGRSSRASMATNLTSRTVTPIPTHNRNVSSRPLIRGLSEVRGLSDGIDVETVETEGEGLGSPLEKNASNPVGNTCAGLDRQSSSIEADVRMETPKSTPSPAARRTCHVPRRSFAGNYVVPRCSEVMNKSTEGIDSKRKEKRRERDPDQRILYSLRKAIYAAGSVCFLSVVLIGYASIESSWSMETKLSDTWDETSQKYTFTSDFGVWGVLMIAVYLVFHNKVAIRPRFPGCPQM
ncbi:hypothetical protein AAMO2058_000993000 [Amorphochlora amoebiformis]